MTVAELCVCSGRAFALAVSVGAERVVLVRDVLGKIWRDHLFHLLRLVVVVVNFLVVIVVVVVVVVVAMHQGGVSDRKLGAP